MLMRGNSKFLGCGGPGLDGSHWLPVIPGGFLVVLTGGFESFLALFGSFQWIHPIHYA